jgi:lipid-A-disaccharide synthase-like uncharacterized protein
MDGRTCAKKWKNCWPNDFAIHNGHIPPVMTVFHWQDQFLGIHWSVWKVVGWLGNLAFGSRFLVQWHATEARGEVVVPPLFWWLSLAGSMLLLSYALFYQKDSVFIFAYAFTWIPYIRNLIIHRRHQKSQRNCPECDCIVPALARFCGGCGTPMPTEKPTVKNPTREVKDSDCKMRNL